MSPDFGCLVILLHQEKCPRPRAANEPLRTYDFASVITRFVDVRIKEMETDRKISLAPAPFCSGTGGAPGFVNNSPGNSKSLTSAEAK